MSIDLKTILDAAKEWSAYITAFISALVTWLVVGRAAKSLAAMQYTRSIFDAWLMIDTSLLGKEELLRKYHEIAGHSVSSGGLEKITVIFMILNPLRSIHIGIMKGYLSKKEYPTLNDNLRRVLTDKDVFDLSQSELFEASFRRLCERLRHEIDSEQETCKH